MELLNIENVLRENEYPGRGIIVGMSADGKKAVTAYFIMGRSVNSRNRVFVPEGEEMRTKAFDESKLTDPLSLSTIPLERSTTSSSSQTVTRQTQFVISLRRAAHLRQLLTQDALSPMSPTSPPVSAQCSLLKAVPSHIR